MSDSNDTHAMGGDSGKGPGKRKLSRGAIILAGIWLLNGALVATLLLWATAIDMRRHWDGTSWNGLDEPPIQESTETTAFLADPVANEDDLRVFDTLRPAIDAVIEEGACPMSPAEDIRRHIIGGRWEGIPDDPSLSPLLWVRICELSERDMREKTEEDWEVIDFAYAFPCGFYVTAADRFLVPKPRDEESHVMTTLVCADGEHEGLVVRNDYLRWAKEPTFEDDYDEAIKRHDEMEDYLRTLREVIPNNKVLLLGGAHRGYDLYIWENEDEGDEQGEGTLSSREGFQQTTQKIGELLPKVRLIATLAPGHPLSVKAETQFESGRLSRDHRYPIPQGQPFISARDFDDVQRLCVSDPRIRLECKSGQDGIRNYTKTDYQGEGNDIDMTPDEMLLYGNIIS